MNTIELRALTDADLDQVSGGMDPNYKYCANGPAGEGAYPLYVGLQVCDPDPDRRLPEGRGAGPQGR